MTDDTRQGRAHAVDASARRAPDDLATHLSRLAHELRTPLAAIASLSEVMRDERLGPLGQEPLGQARYRSYAADIHESAAHAMRVLSGFIEAPSIDKPADRAGEGGGRHVLPMDFVELDLAEVLAVSVSTMQPLASQSGLSLEARIGGALPHLIADRRSVRQIIDNLVVNAMKFTPPGGRISLDARYTVGGAVVLAVADTGDGMTPEELDRARSGVTAPEPVRRRSGGTGFGLPLVRALAAASGAGFAIDSAPRQGTRVTISFPHERVVPV